MNCQEFTQLLDDGDIRSVPASKRQELNAHLSQCVDCAAEWRVQEKIVMTPAMWVPAGFVAQCRQLVAAGAARLVVRRRVMLYGSLPLVAAAALLVWHYSTPATSPGAVASAPVITAPAPAQVQPVPDPEPVKPHPAAPPPGTFMVAVPPLQLEGIDTEGEALAIRFRERVMTLLRDVPNLVLVDTPTNKVTPEYELQMKYTGSSAAPLIRSVRIEVGEFAKIAATEAAIAAEARMRPEDQQRSRISRQRAVLEKSMTYSRGGNSSLSLMLGQGTPTSAIIYDRTSSTDRLESGAQLLVRRLRVNLLPLDESFEREQLETLRNPSQRHGLRKRALGALLMYAERRGGFSSASAEVVRAGGEFALIAESATELQRPAVWDALALTESAELIPYLIRGLDEIALTETRLQLVKILTEKFADDPRGQAALAATARSNEQEIVRMAARWGPGDSQWREYVIATLENNSLSALQRLQPIAQMVPGESAALGTSPSTGMVLEEQQLRELGALVIKVAPDPTAAETARKALFAAGAMDTPAALDMLIDVADALRAVNFGLGREGVAVMGTRQTANTLISRYTGNRNARAIIENVSRNGDAMERALAEGQLRTMDRKADMDKARQNESPPP